MEKTSSFRQVSTQNRAKSRVNVEKWGKLKKMGISIYLMLKLLIF